MDLKTRYNRALKLSQKGAYIKAIEEFDKILSFNPGHADSLSDRGVAKYHINDYKGALEDMDKALNLEPENRLKITLGCEKYSGIIKNFHTQKIGNVLKSSAF